MTMETVRAAGGNLGDISLRRLSGLPRRLRETGMDEIGIGLRDLAQAIKHANGDGIRTVLRPKAQGPWPMAAPRMTFPCHVAIRLRSGGVVETDGRERGGCGSPAAEQQAVVERKFDAVRGAAEMPRAWRRRRPAAQPAG